MEQEQKSTPVRKKQTRSCKLTKEQSDERRLKIFQELKQHIGQPAILFIKEGREMIPYFVELIATSSGIVARYKCYAPNGQFRCYLRHFPSCISLMTGEQKIVYFDDI